MHAHRIRRAAHDARRGRRSPHRGYAAGDAAVDAFGLESDCERKLGRYALRRPFRGRRCRARSYRRRCARDQSRSALERVPSRRSRSPKRSSSTADARPPGRTDARGPRSGTFVAGRARHRGRTPAVVDRANAARLGGRHRRSRIAAWRGHLDVRGRLCRSRHATFSPRRYPPVSIAGSARTCSSCSMQQLKASSLAPERRARIAERFQQAAAVAAPGVEVRVEFRAGEVNAFALPGGIIGRFRRARRARRR